MEALCDFMTKSIDGLVQVGDVREMLTDHEPLVLADFSHERVRCAEG